MWYLDCYSWRAACGREFPVNSYQSESLEVCVTQANLILARDWSGIDEIRVSKETKGQSPRPIAFPTQSEIDNVG